MTRDRPARSARWTFSLADNVKERVDRWRRRSCAAAADGENEVEGGDRAITPGSAEETGDDRPRVVLLERHDRERREQHPEQEPVEQVGDRRAPDQTISRQIPEARPDAVALFRPCRDALFHANERSDEDE